MAKKETKKRRRQAPKKNEKPKGVLRFDPDIGVTYIKLIVRYRDCTTKLSERTDQMEMFTSMGGVEHESSNVSSEIEQLDQEIHQLKLSLVDIGGRLKQELYEADVDAGLIKRLELRGWLDESLHEDLCIRIDEWRYKRKDERDENETSLSLAAPKKVIMDALGYASRDFSATYPDSLKEISRKRYRARKSAFDNAEWTAINRAISDWSSGRPKKVKK